MIKVVISGILGKMGQVLKENIENDTSFTLVAGFDRVESPMVKTKLNDLPDADCLIDFSSPQVLKSLLEYAVDKKLPLVLATTGYSSEDFLLIKKASENIPIFYTENYSFGVHLLQEAIKLVSKAIDSSYDIEIIEKHHRFKKDSPSGTAIKLYQAVHESRKELPLIEGYSDLKGVHVHSLRLGSLPGEHSIIFSSLEETLEFKHIAHDKHVFAKGAMKAAKFIVTKKAGLYNMTDLIGGTK
ncbi:4-hydroxy-tetrahydrodipicolinate reductase [Acholeplasma oculi]|uniref:4-hydroxy-tetrahydrodipicolinate reductase n=1 Tax=Acholeplasma oculi TaxID=35623 RepID=A0A061AC34_9MOLU|nr:4-hydroxy-tetrahydrodipicolinate reductase [Acholeplasma oculi]CDR30969.1 4-Hydroxy-tetrahydrodipicolinate reductase [Acholeplasma oculi]